MTRFFPRPNWLRVSLAACALGVGVLAGMVPGSATASVFYLYAVQNDGEVDSFRNPAGLSGSISCTSGGSPCNIIRGAGSTNQMVDVAFNASGTLYGVTTGNVIRTINTSTGVSTAVAGLTGNNFGGSNPSSANALAFGSETLYTGTNSTNAARQAAFSVNTSTGATTKLDSTSATPDNSFGTTFTIASLGTSITATASTEGDYAFAGSTMYATLRVNATDDTDDGTYLASINTTTGAATLIGKTSLAAGDNVRIEGLAWDPLGNTLWGVSGSNVYTINTSTTNGGGGGTVTVKFSVAGSPGFQGAAGVVPEPASLAVFGVALAGLGLARRWRAARA